MKTVTITRNNGTTYQTTQVWADNNRQLLTKHGQVVVENKTDEVAVKSEAKSLPEAKSSK